MDTFDLRKFLKENKLKEERYDKVKLLKERTNRPYYYVESASLKNYILEEPNLPLVN